MLIGSGAAKFCRANSSTGGTFQPFLPATSRQCWSCNLTIQSRSFKEACSMSQIQLTVTVKKPWPGPAKTVAAAILLNWTHPKEETTT